MPAKKSGKNHSGKSPNAARETAGTGKHPGGRPSKYNADFHPKMAYYLGMLGAQDTKIAAELGIDESTLTRWKQQHPEFCTSLKKGKEDPDREVEMALYRSAVGYTEEPEVKQYLRPKFDPDGFPVIGSDGKQVKIVVREEITTKRVLPNTTAQIFYLKNRMPDRWRDKHDIEQTGNLILHFDKEDEGL